MKYYSYNEIGVDPFNESIATISEQQILDSFYDFWVEKMKNVGKESLISKEKCIEDWVTIHWAWEVEGLSYD